MHDPRQRFSSRVDNYVKYRPDYPGAIIPLLEQRCGLTEQSIIADIGSGTGLLAQLFLRNGNPVLGVEPNREMRAAGERLLADYPNFTSINGAAEATTLPDHAVDFITAGQAFHWFDQGRARREWGRILRPGGWGVLIWNVRRHSDTPFAQGFEELLQRYALDYANVNHRRLTPYSYEDFFGHADVGRATFPHQQRFDLAALRGRLLSSSYAPEPGHPQHEPMLEALRLLFDQHQVDGAIVFEYETTVNYAQFAPLTPLEAD